MNFFVGLDWASQAHAVCVLDVAGQVCWQGSVEHSAEGLAELRRRLARFGPPASLPIAIERRSEEHTSELQSQSNLVCRLLLEKKKQTRQQHSKLYQSLENLYHLRLHPRRQPPKRSQSRRQRSGTAWRTPCPSA